MSEHTEATCVMVFRPGHVNPLGIGLSAVPFETDGEFRREQMAADDAWSQAIAAVSTKDIATAIADSYSARSAIRSFLMDRLGWAQDTRVLKLPVRPDGS